MDCKALDDLIGQFNTFNDPTIPSWANIIIEGMKVLLTSQLQCFNTLNDKIQSLEESKSINENVTSTLQGENRRLNDVIVKLEDKLDDNEQRNRNQCLLFHGIPESSGENTDDLVVEIIKTKLEMRNFSIEDIQRSHRLGQKKNDNQRETRSRVSRPRPIIVRFVSYRSRKNIYKVKTKLKGEGVSLSENLTRKRYLLYIDCIDKLGKGKVWTADGRITTKMNDKYQTITNKSDLNFLLCD
jgi:hypothetical protein